MKRILTLLALWLTASTGFAQFGPIERISKVTMVRGTAGVSVAEVSSVTVTADTACSLGGLYFDVYSAYNLVKYRVWLNCAGGSVAPAAGGGTLVPVAIASGATQAQVGVAVSGAVDALADFIASDNGSGVVTITAYSHGSTTDVSAGTSGFGVSTTTQGVSGSAALSASSVKGDVVQWKICNDAVNTSTYLQIGIAGDDGVAIGKGKCFSCEYCGGALLNSVKMSAQAASDGYSVVQYQK